MIRSEYSRFLQSISNKTVELRKLANIIGDNLDEIIPLTIYQGSRIKKIVELAQTNWDIASYEIIENSQNNSAAQHEIVRIKTLEVGPFRGFARKEIFDLDKPIVLIYGPNGTGKSSFCESLEYGLLGTVAEADSKRFKDTNYLKNAHVNRFESPILKGINTAGNLVEIVNNESLYRFCFLEKNRIDNFSRIVAHVPAKQTELISSLFGLDSFNSFVKNFSGVIDEKHIELMGKNATELIIRRQAVDSSEKLIEQHDAMIEQYKNEAKFIAENYRAGCSFEELKIEFYGNNEQKIGLIKQLQAEISAPTPIKSDLKSSVVEGIFDQIRINLNSIDEGRKQLEQNTKDVSFKNLYEAIIILKEESLNDCPACKTPLNVVTQNPYQLAELEIARLKNLADLQRKVEDSVLLLKNNLMDLAQIINKCNQMYSNNPLEKYKLDQLTGADINWWNSICQKLADDKYAWEHIRLQVHNLEVQDKNTDEKIKLRSGKIDLQSKIQKKHEEIITFNAKLQNYIEQFKIAKKVVDDFTKENKDLIEKVELEKIIIEKNIVIKNTYESLIKYLNEYKDSLPGMLIADLGDLIVRLYNDLNRDDKPSELLSKIKLPKLQNEKLEISFQNAPEKFFDALHILSEGHIRCIGLSILLAKNIKENCPVLIFDDPVNAIDTEHRENIRLTLFSEPLFKYKQIILACHGEEFYKNIQVKLKAQINKDNIGLFTFLPRVGDPHIRINFQSPTKNYILSARRHLDLNDSRNALSESRRALEAIAFDRVWEYVRTYSKDRLSLFHINAKSPIELRNLVDQQISKIGKNDFSATNKEDIKVHLQLLVTNWEYLNKGTHDEDDREEFDIPTVRKIVETLESLDNLL